MDELTADDYALRAALTTLAVPLDIPFYIVLLLIQQLLVELPDLLIGPGIIQGNGRLAGKKTESIEIGFFDRTVEDSVVMV